jgi:hypothetical protein
MPRSPRILRNALATAALAMATVASLSARTTEYLPEQGDLFGQALARIALDPQRVRIDADEAALWGAARYPLPRFDLLRDNPWKVSAYTRIRADNLLREAGRPSRVLYEMHQELGAGVRIDLIEDPLARHEQRVKSLGEDALAYALGKLTGRSLASFRTDTYAQVPQAAREAAALILLAVPDALAYRERALIVPIREQGWDPQEVRDFVWDYAIEYWDEIRAGEDQDPESVTRIETLLDRVDWPVLNAGAMLLTLGTDRARRDLTDPRLELPTMPFLFTAETPLGRVVIAGAGDDTHAGGGALLILDLGGNDFYENAAATGGAAPGASVTLDLGGFDVYHNAVEAAPGLGAGVLGYGILMDQDGNDEYETRFGGEGFGLFGTGLLYDRAGDDQYRGTADVQGCGVFGTGLLIDLEGTDRYEIYQYGQGYGYTLGAGLLLDGGGGDEYYAEMEQRPNGGSFGADRHLHYVQGAASGRRGDAIDGHTWAGGVGWLLDGGGDDQYDCDIYGQGAAIWFGLGLCVDRGGDDVHRAGGFSLGGAAHFGIGIFQDDSGDDRYLDIAAQGLGNGRDFGIGWFEDREGNDTYRAGPLSLGTGDLNGLGFFWDWSGDDTYLARGTGLGQSRMEQAGTLRDPMLTLGLFVDGGGLDRYLRLPVMGASRDTLTDSTLALDSLAVLDFAGNGRIWSRATERNRVPGAFGVGIDGK